mmetsp:Transcript_17507/g.30047  ORF Transcript_17507/g.30047 Transcript_17507/m.30047 type:complete len:82 (-) Transcript_17507:550-795(-)
MSESVPVQVPEEHATILFGRKDNVFDHTYTCTCTCTDTQTAQTESETGAAPLCVISIYPALTQHLPSIDPASTQHVNSTQK